MNKLKNEIHVFYCMKCGSKNLSLSRPTSHQYRKHHRKKLWCWKCKEEVNCVECRTDSEVAEFKEKFEAGEYQKELEESLQYIKNENKVWS